jgi:ATP-dependent Clp protease ATP-binding subunit ClpB
MDEVRKRMRPELLNRLDEQVVFHRLERDQMHAIVDIQLARFRERLAQRDIHCSVSDAAKDILVEAGWDPQYGARPLKRAIQRLIENPLASQLLAGTYASGDGVLIDAAAGELRFSKQLLN